MAASRKAEEFDWEALKKLKMSLFCAVCKKPPRPWRELFTCQECDDVRCTIHRNVCNHGKTTKIDSRLAKFVQSIKSHNCLYFKNGCLMELEIKDLEVHENVCFLRDVICPKHDCKEKIALSGIMDHYQEIHPDLKKKGDTLAFKGSMAELKESTFILECHGRLFYPQFRIKEKEELLHIWVIGHGDQSEINSFEVMVKFGINGRTTFANDFIKPIDTDKVWLSQIGQDCMAFPIKRITQYYDIQSKEFKNQDFIRFELKVISPKLDENAKDETVDSEIEDSETEHNHVPKRAKVTLRKRVRKAK